MSSAGWYASSTFQSILLGPNQRLSVENGRSSRKWVDGRAYSQARLLRGRYRFKGHVRATGEVLVDMVLLLARTGFDAAVLRADQSLDAAHRALTFFPGYYQGGVDDPLPLFAKPPGTADALVRAQEEFVHGGAAI